MSRAGPGVGSLHGKGRGPGPGSLYGEGCGFGNPMRVVVTGESLSPRGLRHD